MTPLRASGFAFRDLREVLAKANEPKSGDQLAGIAAASAQERVAAKRALAELPLVRFVEESVIAPERDELTRAFLAEQDAAAFRSLANVSVGELREKLLAGELASAEAQAKLRRALLPEHAAAVAKLCSNLDLALAAKRLPVVASARTTLGLAGRLASRIQPNHPADAADGIRAAILEGLAYGSGDAVIGVNPVEDRLETVERIARAIDGVMTPLGVPTQSCVLAHVTTQMRAFERGAPLDLVFQSVAGTQKGNRAFGIDLALLGEATALVREKGRMKSPHVWYFETGQGSELSSDAHEGVDQVTLEARCYGVARRHAPLLVNTVVGFIGPEYLFDAREIARAALEDHFMGKLLGVPMGADVCYTNHAEADQNDLESTAMLLASAGCNYFMGVPLGDDCMLHYQSTSYHDVAALRELLGLRPAPELEAWLEARGLMRDGKLTARAGDPRVLA
ncbi:MAG: ethanolamine ammonia-lyase subunit EutB [Deltaproteobacteria bacterium]|nr:ethanolamine ammonia-lyase subunit EutB [Deltaproteobacteria bacterium]